MRGRLQPTVALSFIADAAMPSTLILLALVAAPCVAEPSPEPARAAASDSLRRVWEQAVTWDAYYPAVDARRELWERNWTDGRVSPDLVTRARAASNGLRILAITEPRCSDSANSIPYVARLAEAVPTLDFRLVNSTVGRPWMEAHRTPDGRAATPTVLVLNEAYEVVGCWVEQPKGLQEWWLDVVKRGEQGRNVERKMTWYANDAGRGTLEEIVEILEAAQAGRRICPGAG